MTEWPIVRGCKPRGLCLRGFARSSDRAGSRMTPRIHSSYFSIVSMYYTYFLKLNNNKIYKGSTSDLKRRIQEHKNGKVTSTKYHQPVFLLGYEVYQLKSDALRRERFLKTTEGRRLFLQQFRDTLKKNCNA